MSSRGPRTLRIASESRIRCHTMLKQPSIIEPPKEIKLSPIENEIKPPIVEPLKEISQPSIIEPPKEIKLSPIENEIKPPIVEPLKEISQPSIIEPPKEIKLSPIENEIKPPIVEPLKEISQPSIIEPPKEIKLSPIENEIKPPIVEPLKEISQPSIIEPPKEIKLSPINNTVKPIADPLEINIPKDLKSININAIDIPKLIKKNNTDILITEIPKIKIIIPLPNNQNIKPIKVKITSDIITPKNPNNIILEQTLPQIQNQIKKPIKKEIVKDKPLLQKKELSEEQIKQLDNYKTQIRESIQSVANGNYPRRERDRKTQGVVHIIFELNEDGSLIDVKSGPNTKANTNQALIDAAIKSVWESAPFDKIPVSNKKNEFHVNIIFKIK